MIKITKSEAKAMREMGYGEFVKHTYSSNRHYYLVEETTDKFEMVGKKKVLSRLSAIHALEKYRADHIMER